MVRHHRDPFHNGMNFIVQDAGKADGTRLDFGILQLEPGDVWSDDGALERALMLVGGDITFAWEGESRSATRLSCFDENPVALHVPAGAPVTLTAGSVGAEVCYEACVNDRPFPAKYYGQEDIRNDVFGAGVLGETSIRTVRTVFDGENAPESEMVIGEVINHPGKWSSYPPHDHPHPEIYHYRMFPSQGFGISLLDDEAYKVWDKSTSLIEPDKTHSQVAAAGYAMYYIWMIPHLPGDRWLPTTRYFRKEHEWLLGNDVKIWPERPFEEAK